MKKIYIYEPWFFIFFGIFHLHRIWGLFDRASYAVFWLNVMERKGLFYFVLMGILAVLCILGIITFSEISVIIIGGVGYTYAAEDTCYLICLLLQQDYRFGTIYYLQCLM